MIRAAHKPAQGDAAARRHIAQWRRVTARLQVLMNTGSGRGVMASEAHSLARQCERMAAGLAGLARAAWPASSSGPPAPANAARPPVAAPAQAPDNLQQGRP